MLEARELTVRYGAIEALSEVSISVARGQFVAILGANGAGKSSLMRAISGLAPIVDGEIAIEDRSIRGLPPEAIVRLGLAHVPEGRGIFPDLTVRDNLMIGAYARRGQPLDADYRAVLATFPALAGREAQPGSTLSGGEQQMLAIGRALMSAPKLLLADEVSLGLAPIVVRQVFERLETIRQSGVTLLVVEQNARLAMRHADYVYVLKYGRVVMEGPSRELARSARLVDAYLGV